MSASTLPKGPFVYNKSDRFPADAVYIGRPTKWGNPFVPEVDGSREEVIEKYRLWLLSNSRLMADLHELRGKDLLCWCWPKPCHGDVLLELANK